jgi:heterotetrameric sarcosine oxidase gamma subunit
MLKRSSALSDVDAIDTPRLAMREDNSFTLMQLAAPSREATRILGKMPTHAGIAIEHRGRTLLRVGPDQFWVIGVPGEDVAPSLHGTAFITPLHSSRTRIRLEGQGARDVLARSAALDFRPTAFKDGMFAQSGIHHTPVLIHCLAAQAFHLYMLRTFAVSVWDWLSDAAAGLESCHDS